MAVYPPKHAGPSQIRSYLTTVLTTKHELPLPDATSMANNWRFGREHDLREASQDDFRHLFGAFGPSLYHSVSEDIAAAWHATLAGSLSVFSILSIPTLIVILLFYQGMRSDGFLSRNLPLEYLLWGSGPILTLCAKQEMKHHSELINENLVLCGCIFCLLEFIVASFVFALQCLRG
ncbi:hypothetical protein E8E15_010186 [Penicillium rubens]|jgi:hypothetical protein|nr:uncharacterized protein N7525_001749 [Penicillium rubens]XP_056567114.1 uncharacterized protein N7489_007649 [Penicillium chrysogenum]KAF3029000.1 hypothetical protein E8E15_010186 [Penicillium rubens]KAJ5034292.1 hypothetical protein NUH16_005726 [Penicillium rubens]KAJ5237558.1 hypothetical protein N7489_007649 [Penicillium chrysogenum]KAJ5277860.1 hypothetical protein N7524_004013 [Penicillium chrysogenum]KAJ5844008.1 hypothetical protein N7525_001749 [Penicillium rubens]